MTTLFIGPYTVQWSYPQVIFNPEPANITDITTAQNAEVTTEAEHGFIDGIDVQLFVNSNYRMEINNRTCKIVVTSPTTFLTGINTLQLTPFEIPLEVQAFPAQAVPFTGTLYNTYEQLATPS